ncbi:MAG: YceD family protein [Acidimicrobiia bacterium]
MSEFLVNVADLLHHAGARRAVSIEAPLPGLDVGAAHIDAPVSCNVQLEQVSEGILARGEVAGTWNADCSRCLIAISRPFSVRMAELFETSPAEGETYPLVDETIDLDAPMRDAIAAALPVAPLCREDCQGLCPICGIDRNSQTCTCSFETTDPRWDALSALNISSDEPN